MNSLLKENDISSTIIPRNMFKWKANNIHKALKHAHTIPKLTLLYFYQYPPVVKTRRDICHKHHKQRLCKIISTRVKFHMWMCFWNSSGEDNFGFW